MKISLDLTPGDFLDRLSIARVRHRHLQTADALATVQRLDRRFMGAFNTEQRVQAMPLLQSLYDINMLLWEAEDLIRAYEAADAFGPEFVEIARNIYRFNDQRSRLKRSIDEAFGETPEEKVYTKY